MASYSMTQPRWYLRVGPVESRKVWALVRAYLRWEAELGGRAAAALMRGGA